jgi:hypothetical protein
MNARDSRALADFIAAADPTDVQFSEIKISLSDTWERFIARLEGRESEVEVVAEDPDRENSFNCSGEPGHLNYTIVVQIKKNGISVKQHVDLVRDWLYPLALELAGPNVGIAWDTSLFPVKDSVGKEVVLKDARATCRDCVYSVLFAKTDPSREHESRRTRPR